ncbi:MAG: dihydropyrimidinase, partial [Actinomycetota bacterium]|nr:dihydropyrimidinase [Actinomycetota bacterium]
MLLRGGTVLDVDGERRADLRIGRDGRVAAVAPALDADADEAVIECAGRLLVPGGVDVHTHLHLPVGDLQVSDDFLTGTVAAAIGGTTTIVDYVTAYRGEDPMDALATWRRWAEPACVDYGLHMTFTERVPERAIAACVEAGITSFKLYMAYPDLLQVDDDVIAEVMALTRKHGAFVTLHCENGGAIEALRRAALAEGRTGVMEHARTRPAEMEAEAVRRAAALAERAETSVYVVHLSSAPALAEVRRARARGVDVIAETCPQYLYLDTARLADPDGASYVCTPPL